MITLASASLGLVAALAWNEAIKTTLKVVFNAGDSLAGLDTCDLLDIVVLVALARASARIVGEAAISQVSWGVLGSRAP